MRRLSSMDRDELEQEARKAFDLDSFRAAKSLDPISDALLRDLLDSHRKGKFDATPFFDRNRKRWTVDFDALTEAFGESQKAPRAKGSRPGWTPERRAKTMATKAARKASREKEVTDLKNQVSKLEMEIIESEALIVKQQTDIEDLQRKLAYGQGVGVNPVFSADSFRENILDVRQVILEIGRAFKTADEVLQQHVLILDHQTSGQAVATEPQEPTPVSTLANVPAGVENDPASNEDDQEDLTEMSVFSLNKKAAELKIPADVNKDRLIERIRAAMQS